MERTLVLHVGLPKCGSTSLQDAMADCAALLAADGIRFVRLRPTRLINALVAGRSLDSWTQLLGEEQTEDLVVISSEFLCTLSRDGIEGLLRPIADQFSRIRVVFVLRSLDDWVLSRRNQLAQALPRHGDSSVEVVDDPDELPHGVGLGVGEPDEWLATWSAWADADENRDLLVLPLIGDGPLPQRFLAAVGRTDVELPAAAAHTWSNRSADDHALELIARMHDLSELLRMRADLTSIREDTEVFAIIKQVISIAKKWDRPADVKPSPHSLRSAAKAANAIRDRMAAGLHEPLLSEVTAIVGTKETAKRERKRKLRDATEATAAHDTAVDQPVEPTVRPTT